MRWQTTVMRILAARGETQQHLAQVSGVDPARITHLLDVRREPRPTARMLQRVTWGLAALAGREPAVCALVDHLRDEAERAGAMPGEIAIRPSVLRRKEGEKKDGKTG